MRISLFLDRRLWLLGLVAALSVCLGLVTFSRPTSTLLFKSTAFWWITGGVLIWGALGWRVLRESWARSELGTDRSAWLLGGLTMLAAVCLCWVHQPVGLKIVADEPLQMLTAKSLFQERQAVVLARGYDLGAGFEPINSFVDKRPVLYAWVCALSHTLTGYRLENPFYVNRVLSVLLAGWLFVVGRRLVGNWGGALLAGLFMLAPMFAQNANSGGFEILNVLLIVALWHAAMLVLEAPTSPLRLSWLAWTAGLLIHCRYESVVFLIPAGVVVAVAWLRAGRLTVPWLLIASSLMATPRLWLQRLFQEGDTWQLSSKPEAQGQAFGFRFFYDNVGHALGYYFSFEKASANSVLLALAGAGCVGFWVMAIYRDGRRRVRPSAALLGTQILWGGLCLHLLLMMLYFWGQFDDLTTQRLALPTHLWLAVPVVGLTVYVSRMRAVLPALTGIVCGALLWLTVPQLRLNRFNQVNYASRSQNVMLDYVAAHPSERRLVIDGFSAFAWLLTDTPVTIPRAVLGQPEKIRFHWKHHTFDEVLLVQRMRYDVASTSWWAFPEDTLGPDFTLEQVWANRMTPVYGIRLMRVTNIASDHLDWKPEVMSVRGMAEAVAREPEYQRQWAKELP